MKQCLENWQPTYIASSVELITPAVFREGLALEDFDTVLFDSRTALVPGCSEIDHDKVCDNMRRMSLIGLDLYLLNEEGDRRQDELEGVVRDEALDIDVICPDILEVESALVRPEVQSLPAMIDFVIKKKRLPTERVLMVGDSILTDVVAANRAGIYSLLLPEHHGPRRLADGVRRVAEAMIRKYLLGDNVPACTDDFPDTVTAASPLHSVTQNPHAKSIRRYLRRMQKESEGDLE